MAIQWNKVTWYSKLVALALFVALPFIGFWYGMQYGEIIAPLNNPIPAPSGPPAVADPASDPYYANVAEWQTDQNIQGGWSIAYPIDFPTTDDYSAAPMDNWRVGTPGGPGLQPFSLAIPKMFEPQTNFGGATLTVGMSGNGQAVAQCLVAEPTDGPNVGTSTVVINGATFTVFHWSDVGAGQMYETTSYRTLHAGQCYAVEYTVHSSQIGNYPPSYDLHQLDSGEVDAVLDRIVGTFKFL
ncbi:MAG TPA: hypothetical protein VMT81_00615 [Candidatus Paceibacterota bacterium]|nr:hypothetical protein [Candidatus Paceibacterota bacterium]